MREPRSGPLVIGADHAHVRSAPRPNFQAVDGDRCGLHDGFEQVPHRFPIAAEEADAVFPGADVVTVEKPQPRASIASIARSSIGHMASMSLSVPKRIIEREDDHQHVVTLPGLVSRFLSGTVGLGSVHRCVR